MFSEINKSARFEKSLCFSGCRWASVGCYSSMRMRRGCMTRRVHVMIAAVQSPSLAFAAAELLRVEHWPEIHSGRSVSGTGVRELGRRRKPRRKRHCSRIRHVRDAVGQRERQRIRRRAARRPRSRDRRSAGHGARAR